MPRIGIFGLFFAALAATAIIMSLALFVVLSPEGIFQGLSAVSAAAADEVDALFAIEAASATPTSTASPTQTLTSSPTFSPTPEASDTLINTATHSPTAAVPTETASPTPTPTLTSPPPTETATPTATNTALPTLDKFAGPMLPTATFAPINTAVLTSCTDEEPISAYPRYARLMHDPQWMPWPSRIANPEWPRGYYFDWYPETVQLWTAPKSGDGRVAYSVEWLEFLRAIQPNDEAAVWIARVAGGLFNRGNVYIPILDLDQLQEEPVAEGISSGGNVVLVLEEKKRSARIEMLFFKDSPPDPLEVNYESAPWLVTKFTAVSIDGQLGNPGNIDVYFPNLAKLEDGYWVEMKRVELFPELPFCAAVQTRLNVRAEPSLSAERIGQLQPDQLVMVREYRPEGGNVWGRTDAGWIALQYHENGQPVFNTSWEMETRPPIEPKE